MFEYISASISTFKGLVFSKRIQIIINLICVVRQDGIVLHVKHLRYLWGEVIFLTILGWGGGGYFLFIIYF
jgi:hypothetical protein